MSQNYCNGPFKNIAEVKISNHRSLTKMIGWKQPVLSLEEMTRSVNTNLTKIKNQQFKKVIG